MSPSTGHNIVRDFRIPSRCKWDLPSFGDFTQRRIPRTAQNSVTKFILPWRWRQYVSPKSWCMLSHVSRSKQKFLAVPSRTSRHSATWYVTGGNSPALFSVLKPRPGRPYWQRSLRFSFIFRFTRYLDFISVILHIEPLCDRDIAFVSRERSVIAVSWRYHYLFWEL
jgi:hypothetical protein